MILTEKEVTEIIKKYTGEFLGFDTIDENGYNDIWDDLNDLIVKKLIIDSVSNPRELLIAYKFNTDVHCSREIAEKLIDNYLSNL